MIPEAVVDLEAGIPADAVLAEIGVRELCIRPPVLNAASPVKCLSVQAETDRFTAVIVIAK